MAKKRRNAKEATDINVKASNRRDTGLRLRIATLAATVRLLAVAVGDIERRLKKQERASGGKKAR